MALPSVSAAHTAVAVTPSDSTTIAPTRALYIGTGGDLVVQMAANDVSTSVTFKNVPAGILPIQVVKVLSTNTTALNILALY